MEKLKIALFRQFGKCTGGDLPEGCPEEYRKDGQRHKLAEWLEQNAKNDGPFIVEQWKDGVTTYEYLSKSPETHDIEDWEPDKLTRLVVVEVDNSRPWGIFDLEGPYEEGQRDLQECVCYLDRVAGEKQVIPEYMLVDTGYYRWGEEENRGWTISMKEWEGNVWSVSLTSGHVSRKGFLNRNSVKDTIEFFNRCAAWGVVVDTFSFEEDFGGRADIYGYSPKGVDALLWLRDRTAIDPDFRLPKKIEILTKRLVSSSLVEMLEEMYGRKSVTLDLGNGKVIVARKEENKTGQEEMDNVKRKFKEIAGESLKIITEGEYEVNNRTVILPQKESVRFSMVEVFSPDKSRRWLTPDTIRDYKQAKMCRFTVTNEDSFRAAERLKEPMVLNFASARHPGGGFLNGALAQEESLCRCSTLFASLSSKEAQEMYAYNNENQISTYSDYMLFSPYVVVFRDTEKGLLEKPFVVSVASVPAPNRSAGARYETDDTIREVLLRRIRRMLTWAVKNGNKNAVLGAWGCGVFKNDPKQVASCFRQVLVDEGYGFCFDEVCFAVYGRAGNPNLLAFEEAFA